MPGDFIKNHLGTNIKYPTSDHGKNAQKINESINALNKAKEKIKQQIIASDKSPDNSVIYTAITQFKKANE